MKKLNGQATSNHYPVFKEILNQQNFYLAFVRRGYYEDEGKRLVGNAALSFLQINKEQFNQDVTSIDKNGLAFSNFCDEKITSPIYSGDRFVIDPFLEKIGGLNNIVVSDLLRKDKNNKSFPDIYYTRKDITYYPDKEPLINNNQWFKAYYNLEQGIIKVSRVQGPVSGAPRAVPAAAYELEKRTENPITFGITRMWPRLNKLEESKDIEIRDWNFYVKSELVSTPNWAAIYCNGKEINQTNFPPAAGGTWSPSAWTAEYNRLVQLAFATCNNKYTSSLFFYYKKNGSWQTLMPLGNQKIWFATDFYGVKINSNGVMVQLLFIVYYDVNRLPKVVYAKVPSNLNAETFVWKSSILPGAQYPGFDAHKYLTMSLSDGNEVHFAGIAGLTPLHYWKAKLLLNNFELSSIHHLPFLGVTSESLPIMNLAAYPMFHQFSGTNRPLLMTFRHGTDVNYNFLSLKRPWMVARYNGTNWLNLTSRGVISYCENKLGANLFEDLLRPRYLDLSVFTYNGQVTVPARAKYSQSTGGDPMYYGKLGDNKFYSNCYPTRVVVNISYDYDKQPANLFSSGFLQIFWADDSSLYGSGRVVSVKLKDRQTKQYILEIPENSASTNPVTKLRIDPCNMTGCKFSIQSVRIIGN